MKITMAMMDAAKDYIEQTNSMTFHYMYGDPAIRLALRIKDANGPSKITVTKWIADTTLLKVSELMESHEKGKR